jgi:hypothetical protein
MEYIYILRSYGENGISHLKLGYTSDIWKRLSQYRHTNPHIEVVYIAQLENALKIEQEFHSKHKAVFGDEWYDEKLLDGMMEFINRQPHENVTNLKKVKAEKAKKAKPSFREVVLECQKGDSDYLLWAFKRYAFLHEAIKYLGYDKIREYDYAMPRVKRAIVAFTDKPEESKIKMLLTNYKFSKGVFVSNEDLKSMFAEIYSQIGISKSPKAKDIETYFKVKTHQKRIKNERIHGVVIL